MRVSDHDRSILRGLACRVAEIAALPIQAERTRLWTALNALRPVRPPVIAFNEDLGGCGWPVAGQENECTDPLLRSWERGLRLRIFEFENIPDDHPVTGDLNVGWVIRLGDPGLESKRTRNEADGFDSWDHPLVDEEALARLRFRTVEVDHALTAENTALAQDILGDILRVRVTCGPAWRWQDYNTLSGQWWSDGLCQRLVALCGAERVMYDMYDRPDFLHRVMAFFRDDALHMLLSLEQDGVLSPNNGPDDYVGSGTMGATDLLPLPDSAGSTRLLDMWGLAESQDFASVGPSQWHEFSLQYQLPIINRYGLACYGCCEPLDKKYDLLFKHIPRLRRLSVTSPYADRRVAAEKLGNHYVYSWKPNPAWLSGDAFDDEFIEKTTRETLQLAREHGCCLEIVMKGYRTDYRRIIRWAQVTSRAVQEMSW
jgi:hypothetical protein